MVYYNPDTQLELKRELEDISLYGVFSLGYHDISCNCNNLTCGCCTNINLPRPININGYTCINFSIIPKDLAINFKLTINDKVLLNKSLSGE